MIPWEEPFDTRTSAQSQGRTVRGSARANLWTAGTVLGLTYVTAVYAARRGVVIVGYCKTGPHEFKRQGVSVAIKGKKKYQ